MKGKKEKDIKNALAGTLTEKQVSEIFSQGEEAVVFAMLILAKERDELAKEREELAKKLDRLEKKPPRDTDEISPSTPPGMVPLYKKPPASKRKKKPGRKKGHKGSRRPAPPRIDRREEHTLEQCPNCGGKLPEPSRTRTRIIEDIPEIHPEVTEHIIHGCYCKNCNKIVEPKVPDALPNATIGNRLLVYTAWLHYGLGITIKQIVSVLNYHLHFKLTEGGLVQMWQRLGKIVTPWYDEIGREARSSAALNADETGWRVSGDTNWLWCFASDDVTYYMIDRSRGREALKKFFTEEFEGTLITDFWHAYDKVVCGSRQKCLVHLLRELEKVDARNESPGWLAFRKKLRRLIRDAFRLAERGEISQEKFASKRTRLDARLDGIIEDSWNDKDAIRLAKRLSRHRDEIFTFLDYAAVPADNNRGEREIRPAVVMRKNSNCNRSAKGALAQSILMSVYRTLKRRGQNPMDALTSALKNYILTSRLPPLPKNTVHVPFLCLPAKAYFP